MENHKNCGECGGLATYDKVWDFYICQTCKKCCNPEDEKQSKDAITRDKYEYFCPHPNCFRRLILRYAEFLVCDNCQDVIYDKTGKFLEKMLGHK